MLPAEWNKARYLMVLCALTVTEKDYPIISGGS